MALLSIRISESSPPDYRTLFERISSLWNDGKFDDCERSLRATLEDMRNSGLNDLSHSLQLALVLTILSRIQFRQKHYDECTSHLKEAEKILTSLSECPSSLQIAWLLERARLFVAEKTPSQARLAYEEAWAIAITSKDEAAAVEIAEMMAEIEPPKVRMTWIEKGIELALSSKSDVPKKRLPVLYRSQGLDRHEFRRYADALESFDHAKEAAKLFGNGKEEVLAELAKGKTLRIMQQLPEALELQMQLLRTLEDRGERSGLVYEEIAECLQALKRPEEAESYYALAYHELASEPSLDDRRPQALKRLKTLGKVKGP